MKLLSRMPKVAAAKPAVKPARPAFSPKILKALEPLSLPGELGMRLRALRRRHRLVAIVTGIVALGLSLSVMVFVECICDWCFNLPWGARAGFFIAELVVIGVLYRRCLHAALRQKLTLTQTALLIERKWPDLRQCVVAAVQLSEGGAHSTRGSMQLVGVALEQARARTISLDFRQVVSMRALGRWLLGALLALGVIMGSASYGWPASYVLVQRFFLFDVPLPTKTIVVPITRDLVVPVGSDVTLIASAQGVIPAHGRVTITYAGNAPQEIPIDLEPEKAATFSLALHNVQGPFKYNFTLNDGRGPDFNVAATIPPSLTALACEQTFPSYTGLTPRKLAPTDLSLLVGSHLKVTATASESVTSAALVLQGLPNTIPMKLDVSGRNLEADLPIPVKDLTGFSIHLIAASGANSANETVYPVVLIPDDPPTIKIVDPLEDRETMTLRAKPVIAFDATDDYGIESLTLHYEIVPPSIAGEEDPTSTRQQTMPIKIHARQEGTHYEQVLDIAAQVPAWHEGDLVNYWIEARDNNNATGPGITNTDKKQLSIISVEAKQQEILEMLKQNAADINTMSDAQQKVSNNVGETVPQK